jgi:hypothetical protein
VSLMGGMERTIYLEDEVVRLQQQINSLREVNQIALTKAEKEIERLRAAIHAHMTTVCDNPKAAGTFADDRLWAVLEPVPQSGS